MITCDQYLSHSSSTFTFQQWAWETVRIMIGITQKDADRLINWGVDSGAPIFIPKTSKSLFQTPRLAFKDGIPYLSFSKMVKKPFVKIETRLIFGFDVITAVGWLLGGFEEYLGNISKDRYGRWKEENSLILMHGFSQRPVVNEWINAIRDFFVQIGENPLPLWPEGKKFAVALTHDVDNPYYSSTFWFKKLLCSIIRFHLNDIQHSLMKLSGSLIIAVKDNFHSQNGFINILNEESRLGLTSTLMVSGLSRNNDYIQINDPIYEVSEDCLKSSLELARNRGFFIGLHASATAAPVVQRYREQKSYVESIYGKKLQSCRHHYWNISRRDNAEK